MLVRAEGATALPAWQVAARASRDRAAACAS